MPNDDLLAEAQIDATLQAIAACLRRALGDVEAATAADDTPLGKIGRAADALEELGESLERCLDCAWG